MSKISLGERMKRYEDVSRYYLMRRNPVIIRLDGKSFHSFTRGFQKTYDDILIKVMQQTLQTLCDSIEGCVIGYTQSDEISLVLCDYRRLDSEAWFDYNILKLCSVSASITTAVFNRLFRQMTEGMGGVYEKRLDKAFFDARAFSLPKEEVNNYFVWRQRDAVRNSVRATAQAYFSSKQLHGVSREQSLEMLKEERSVDWNSFPLYLQRGSCCIKVQKLLNEGTEREVLRNVWKLDEEIPIFSDNPDYVNSCIQFGDEV
ncbi:MAG: tRNA(His) guanylyltransferase Thg1 family protein [Ruminococcus sp.]